LAARTEFGCAGETKDRSSSHLSSRGCSLRRAQRAQAAAISAKTAERPAGYRAMNDREAIKVMIMP